MKQPPQTETQSGFTLVELLVALALMGLLSLVLFGGLHFGHRVWEASETATAADNRIRAFQLSFSDLLARAYPEIDNTDPTRPTVAFIGRPDGISFLAPDPDGSGQLVRINYSEIETRLEKSTVPELALSKYEKVTDQKLAPIMQLRFAYYGTLAPEEQPAWHDRWENVTTLPERVSLRVVFADKRLVWPDLIVHPNVAADVSCVFDAFAHKCQGQ